jgi:glycosyltransferase involved in cell wall biosynthesis
LRIVIFKPVGYISRMGGTSERILQIANELADQGIEVVLSGALETELKIFNPKHLKLLPRPDRIIRLHRVLPWFVKLFIESAHADIIQIESLNFFDLKNSAFSFIRCLILFLPLRPLGVKFLMVFHEKCCRQDPRKSISGRLSLFLHKILLTIFDAFIAPGLSIKKWFEEMYGKLGKKMVVIPSGAPELAIEIVSGNPRLREKYDVPSSAFIALFFGSMSFPPNYESALGLYKISNTISQQFEKETGKSLVFIVAGQHSEILPKSKCYIPLGFVDELDELLSLPDVILLPHLPSYSGPHVKTIYAFQSKKPVIATADGIKDWPGVVAREHFLPFDLNNPETLLACLKELYFDRQLYDTISRNAYSYAKNFSWEAVSLMHIKLYKALIAGQEIKSQKYTSLLPK